MRVSFHTLGCKTNQYDTERMRQELEARGGATVTELSGAEVCVLNSCTVTNQADAEARKLIRRMRRENPRLRIIVAGCSAALRAPQYEAMAGVAGVVRGHDPVAVAEAVETALPPLISLRVRGSLERLDREPVGGRLLLEHEGRTRGWLKIQDGCDRKCAFCATRLARGPSRSRSQDEIVREAVRLARRHPELVLTGVHIGHYGRDLSSRDSLAGLLRRLVDEVPDVRFRLGSIEATEVDDPLLDLLATESDRVAPHLHMPLQSGSDAVLRRMRRWHTRQAYRARALEIAGRLSTLGLGADIITGYPGETEAEHEETLALVEELPFTYLHVFPFSPRDGTPAAELVQEMPVPQRVAGERSRELRERVVEKGATYRSARLGGPAEVALERAGTVGLTGDYLRVAVRNADPERRRALHTGVLQGRADHPYIDLSHTSAPI